MAYACFAAAKKKKHLVVVKVSRLSWWKNTADSGVGQPQLHYTDAMDDVYRTAQGPKMT